MSGETVTAESGGQPTSDPAASSVAVDNASTAGGGSDDTPTVDTNKSGTEGQGDPGAVEGGAQPQVDPNQLISDEEFAELQDDPGELRRRLQKAYTEKSQAAAPAHRLFKALQENPDQVLDMLAKARGKTLADGEGGAKGSDDIPDPEKVLLDALSEAIGPDAAQKTLPAIQQMVELRTKAYREESQRLVAAANQEAAQRVEAAFTQKYPDWKKHEPAMIALASHVEPKGLSPFQYMELLHAAVDRQGSIGREVGQHIQQQQKAAKAILESGTGGSPAKPPESSSSGGGEQSLRDILRESLAAAKRK